MMLMEEDLDLLERFECEVDILLLVSYKAVESLESYPTYLVRQQFDRVNHVFEDLKRSKFFSN